MKNKFISAYQEQKNYVEKCLKEIAEKHTLKAIATLGMESMNYSLLAGGKRIRPILCLQSADLYHISNEAILPYASALEMIHTYSLIHDDLPAMDDDDLRRGKPTNHKVYGEAIAILAGDGLLNLAYEIMLNDLLHGYTDGKLKAVHYIAKAAGIHGMVAGQVLDLQMENQRCDADLLKKIHRNKTGELLKASILAGALVGGASEEDCYYWEQYADHLGLVFQITDDMLDVIGNVELMGKNTGMDSKKNTYPQLFGLEKSVELAKCNANSALCCLEKIEKDTYFLEELINQLLERER